MNMQTPWKGGIDKYCYWYQIRIVFINIFYFLKNVSLGQIALCFFCDTFNFFFFISS